MAYNPKTGKGLGRFYSAEHRAFRAREWRGFRDTFYDFFRWLYLYGFMAAKLGCHPILMVKAMLRYRWMVSYLTASHMVDRHTMGLRGKELRYAHNQFFSVLHNSVLGVRDIIVRDKNLRPNSKRAAKLRENTVMFDEMTPHLIMMGFPTVKWIDIAMFAVGLPSEVDQNASMFYIDAMEHLGLPADVCSRCAAETGVALDDAFPLFGKAMISTNMPCNASEATSMFQRRRIGLPDFQATMAMIHNEPAAHPYSAQVLQDCIDFVEKEYGVKYDWNALFKRAKHMNEQNRLELEKWDYFKTPYCPMTGINETLYRLYAWASVNGLEDYFTKNDRKVMKILRKCYKNKYVPYGGTTRHRAFLWGPSAVYYTDFPTWTQNCWGINIVLNMDSTMGHNMINTTDPEQALQDLAAFSEKGTMRHMAVGGWDNVNSVWEWAKNFNCDMVLMNDNIACKGMLGVHAMMEEQARDLGFHFIFIEHDLQDCRTVSRQDMRNCVNQYMAVVLNEKPLDPTLVEFDDSAAY